jgi:transcriptional regulator with XRE-family HTH domain
LDSTAFGSWLRRNRTERRWTQETLGERTGCAASYISTLENAKPHSISGGTIQPSEAWIANLANAFDCPLSEARLMAGYSPTETLRPDEEVTRILSSVPAERQPALIEAFRAMARAVAA